MTRSNTGGGGGATGGGGGYTLPLAADGVRGGVQVGYTTDATARKYAVQLDNEKAYVNVPWTDHTYTLAGLVGGSAIGGTTQPIYWNGSSFVNTSYTLAKSVPSDAVFTDTNTWRPVEDNLTSTSTTNSLSANQGRVLNNKFGSYLPLAGGAMNSGARISFNGGNGYIGNADNAGWLMVQDICSQASAGDTYWSLRTNGNAHFANVYSAGYVTALSDARKKRVMGDVVLSAEQIAQMPAVRFEWKDPKKPGMFIGTLAQNWREILPEAVHTLDDGTLSFDYQSAALVSVINLAREIEAIKSKLNRYGFK